MESLRVQIKRASIRALHLPGPSDISLVSFRFGRPCSAMLWGPSLTWEAHPQTT